jgi:formylglycine-generating enzyme required for sulfatase activity
VPDYELVHLLGRGGCGEVWQARGPGGFDVALKFVRLGDRAARVELRALELMKGIRHGHLLPMFGAWQREGLLIIAMELGRCTVLDRLREALAAGLPGIPQAELLEHLRDAAKGLDYLNEARHPSETGKPVGIQHKDVKPQNLLLVGDTVKVADFGLARLLEGPVTTASGHMTPAYAAPEFFNGQATRWSDQYCLAVTYCQLRGGRLPFEGSLAQMTAGHLTQPPDLTMLPEPEQAVVARALSKVPEERWPSCRAFAEAVAFAAMPAAVPLDSGLRPASDHGDEMAAALRAVEEAHAEAHRLAEEQHDFAAAVTALERVPSRLRDAELHAELCDKRDRVARLDAEVRQALRDKQTAGLRRKVTELLGLQPERSDLRDLLARLPKTTLQAGKVFTNFLGMKFAWCPPGSFLMGSPPEEEGRSEDEELDRVTLRKGLFLGTGPVTRGQFARFAAESGYTTEAERDGGAMCWVGAQWQKDPRRSWRTPGFEQTDDHPVVCVSFHDALAMCRWLKEQDSSGHDYRLPTEEEWEYACRAGAATPFSFGATITTDQANYDGNGTYGWGRQGTFRRQTTPVGSFSANTWGLFDMHGNVWEWCDSIYSLRPSTRPTGAGSAARVLRGGSWYSLPEWCRCANRNGSAPSSRGDDFGFRICFHPS